MLLRKNIWYLWTFWCQKHILVPRNICGAYKLSGAAWHSLGLSSSGGGLHALLNPFLLLSLLQHRPSYTRSYICIAAPFLLLPQTTNPLTTPFPPTWYALLLPFLLISSTLQYQVPLSPTPIYIYIYAYFALHSCPSFLLLFLFVRFYVFQCRSMITRSLTSLILCYTTKLQRTPCPPTM